MSASRVMWGQIAVVFAIVLLAVWIATQWIAWRLGFQPQLGAPWFALAGWPVYPPPAFLWWWFFYDAYAPHVFLEDAGIAASGSLVAIATAILMSIYRGARGQGREHLRLRPLGRAG